MINQEELATQLLALRSLAIALVGFDEADSILSRVFLKASHRPPRHKRNIKAWLASMIKSESIDKSRADLRRVLREKKVPASRFSETPPELLEKAEMHSVIHNALMELPESKRHILILRYDENLSASEIGAQFGISRSAARTRISRALGGLRHKLRADHGKDILNSCLLMFGAPSHTIRHTFTPSFVSFTASLIVGFSLVAWHTSQGTKPLSNAIVAVVSPEQCKASDFPAKQIAEKLPTQGPAIFTRNTIFAEFHMELLDEDGKVITNADSYLFKNGKSYRGKAKHYASGLYYFPDTQHQMDGSEVVLILASGRAPFLYEMQAIGKHLVSIRLPKGEHLSGKVQFLHSELKRPLYIGLDLSSVRPEPSDRIFQLKPKLTRAQIKLIDRSYYNCSLKIDDAGGFDFWGLPQNWSGELSLTSKIYRLRGARTHLGIQRLFFHGPEKGLQLQVEENPTISGIVESNEINLDILEFTAIITKGRVTPVLDWSLNEESGEFQLVVEQIPTGSGQIQASTQYGNMHFDVAEFNNQNQRIYVARQDRTAFFVDIYCQDASIPKIKGTNLDSGSMIPVTATERGICAHLSESDDAIRLEAFGYLPIILYKADPVEDWVLESWSGLTIKLESTSNEPQYFSEYSARVVSIPEMTIELFAKDPTGLFSSSLSKEDEILLRNDWCLINKTPGTSSVTSLIGKLRPSEELFAFKIDQAFRIIAKHKNSVFFDNVVTPINAETMQTITIPRPTSYKGKEISGFVLDGKGHGLEKAIILVKDCAGDWGVRSISGPYGKFSLSLYANETLICARVSEGSHSNSFNTKNSLANDDVVLRIGEGHLFKLQLPLPWVTEAKPVATRIEDDLPIRVHLNRVGNTCNLSIYCFSNEDIRFAVDTKNTTWEQTWNPITHQLDALPRFVPTSISTLKSKYETTKANNDLQTTIVVAEQGNWSYTVQLKGSEDEVMLPVISKPHAIKYSLICNNLGESSTQIKSLEMVEGVLRHLLVH
ncbi:MAG: RNA polymerase sigma factor [Planctomycetes bacterium]|nr:RNA polymerase sigma factor [Planctomycetota bacterium]MBT7318247.1 RNA polymerase sigma factor [Planctomycetota bacterium]